MTEPKEKPILFQGEMVRAIIEGRKTQTRRLLVKSTEFKGPYNPAYIQAHRNSDGWKKICPYGEIGGVLWVRERFKVAEFSAGHERNTESGFDFEEAGCRVVYAADGENRDINDLFVSDEVNEIAQAERAFKKNGDSPGIHMPRWACRLRLKITDIRVERLQDISHKDAIAEGVEYDVSKTDGWPLSRFESLWKKIHGKESWDSNPWLWVLDFEVLK